MTANRNIPKDQIATSALLNRFAYDPDAVKDEEGPNWLGHGAKTDKRAGAQIDAALVLGATEKELCEIRPTWREHLFHLSKEHGLTVVRQADIYRFQDPEQTEEADALLSAEQAQEPFVDVRAQIDVKRDPQRIAQAVTPSRVCAFVVLPSRTEEQAEVVLTYSIREGTDHLKVFANRTVFIVTGMLKDAVQAAANAVASVWNMWVDDRPDHPQRPRPIPGHYVRPREDWANERLPMNGGNYVYEYRGSKSETFYVGKGRKARAAAHVNEVRRLLDQKCPVTTFSRKQRAIFENVEAGHVEQLYRIVADFSGPYAELCAFAVERFLICSVYGVHRLANDTQGDSKWSVRDRREAQCDWLCKPRSDNAELETVWLRVGNDFVSEGRLLQKASNDLKLLITESWIAGIRNQLEPLERRGLDYIGFGNNGADVSVEWHIRGLPIRIQLVFSSKCTDVGINLRPRVSKWCAEPSQEDRIAFEEYVAVRLPRPGTVALQIKIPDSRNCFVKPYSEGNLHPRFDIANSAAVVSVRSLLEDKRLELNFTDAMTHLLDALLTQDACSKGG